MRVRGIALVEWQTLRSLSYEGCAGLLFVGVLLAVVPWGTQEASQGVCGDAPGVVQSGGELGRSLASGQDFDGDGVLEIVAGSPYASPKGKRACGLVQVVSGRTGKVILELEGSEMGEEFGSRVGVLADIDKDGVGELIVAAPNWSDGRGRVTVRAGSDGRVMCEVTGTTERGRFGDVVAGLVGGEGDGPAGVVAGLSVHRRNGMGERESNSGLSDADGLLRLFDARKGVDVLDVLTVSPRLQSVSVSVWKSVGESGVLVGVPQARSVSKIRLWDAQKKTVWSKSLVEGEGEFGTAVVGLPDVDSDGIGEVGVGSPILPGSALKSNQSGEIFVLSGESGVVLRRLSGGLADHSFGEAISATTLQGRVACVVVGSPRHRRDGHNLCGKVAMIQVGSGEIVWEVFGLGVDRMGATICNVGDVSGDGSDDFAVGSPGSVPGKRRSAGKIVVLSGKDGRELWSLTGLMWDVED